MFEIFTIMRIACKLTFIIRRHFLEAGAGGRRLYCRDYFCIYLKIWLRKRGHEFSLTTDNKEISE